MLSVHIRGFARAIAACALALLAGCASPTIGTGSAGRGPGAATPSTTPNDEVVLAASAADNQDIYLVDVKSGQPVRLTRDPDPDGVAVWSPTGSRLAFVRFALDGSSTIHLMNPDGSGDQPLVAQTPGAQILPTWSPDGGQIAFAEIIGNGGSAGTSEIVAIRADGAALRELTHDPSGHPNDPIWSPDGSRIAFTAGDAGRALYVMDPTGGSVRRVTPPDPQLETNWPLSWSPDGSSLALAGTGPDGTRDVYVVNADGSRLQDLTAGGRDEGPPAWSPDGRRLAYWSDRDGRGDIYVVTRAGGAPQRLTTGSQLSGTVTLAWSPDGRQLIVWNRPSGQGSDTNYVLDANGGNLRRLTNGLGGEFMALWRPNG